MAKTVTVQSPNLGLDIETLWADKSNYKAVTSRNVSYIVMHYTGNTKDTAINNCKYYQGEGRGASAHYFVDETKYYQSVALHNQAWHCGAKTYKHKTARNANSVGIEMCCSGNYKVSEKTIARAVKLCAALCKYLGITDVDTYVIRHYDVTGKKCPAQMAGDDNTEWASFKARVKAALGASETTTTTKTAAASTATAVSYRIRIECDSLNVRKGAGTSYDVVTTVKRGEIYTIVAESNGWGKLKSGVGWIKLSYTKRV